MTFSQEEFDIRCEWGLNGVQVLAPACDAVIVVDVLSFSSCVDIATSRGATVWPYRWRDPTATVFARGKGAQLAGLRSAGALSLSPESMLGVGADTLLVLPSPNGSSLSLGTGDRPTFAGCLRNASAVAAAALLEGPRVAVIPAGELWPDRTLRPCLEDWLGAGAILAQMTGKHSPEALAAIAGYQSAAKDIVPALLACGSGKELVRDGYGRDVELAADVMVSESVPKLVDYAFTNVGI